MRKKCNRQLFHTGDVVSVGPLPEEMSHFYRSDKAIVLYSYRDMYGGGREEPVYALQQPKTGFSSWYPQSLLTLVRKPRRCKCCKYLLELLWNNAND